MRSDLDAVRLHPDFSNRSAADQNLLWHTMALIHSVTGDAEGTRRALRERRALANLDEERAEIYGPEIAFAETAEEGLALIPELKALAMSSDLGPIFSRERLGRVSVRRDAFFSATVSAEVSTPTSVALLNDGIDCYETWLFGRCSETRERTIQVVSNWSGQGRVALRTSTQTLAPSAFGFDPDLVVRWFSAMDRLSQLDRGAAREAIGFLDHELGPLLDQVVGTEQLRIRTLGAVSLLPLLMTMVAGAPLGAREWTAYAHPNPDVEAQTREALDPFDLFVVDLCFGEDSNALRREARRAGTSQIVEFDSSSETTAIQKQGLIDALESARSALVFCHVSNDITRANEAGLVLGPSSRLTIEELVVLNLKSLDELALVGCASGRGNPFLGDVTMAHAAALAGAGEILSTLWPIRPTFGARFIADLLRSRDEQIGTSLFLSHQFSSDRIRAAPFALMRP